MPAMLIVHMGRRRCGLRGGVTVIVVCMAVMGMVVVGMRCLRKLGMLKFMRMMRVFVFRFVLVWMLVILRMMFMLVARSAKTQHRE